ncbi:hypothetical protein WDU94_011857 [Cyamophila willieti]
MSDHVSSLKQTKRDVERRSSESREDRRGDDHVHNVPDDFTNGDIVNHENNIPGQGNDIVEDASLNVDNLIPDTPVKMTYILPKEVNLFKMGMYYEEPMHDKGNGPSGGETDLDFDDVLPHLGEFGRYQKILFFAMIPFAFSVAFVYFAQIFIAVIPERYWCRVPELAHLDPEQR